MIAVLIAQFLSALADNILLFVILGFISTQGAPDWAPPLLQQSFLLAYIFLAPFVGAIADGYAKNRVMLCANSLKFFAVIFLMLGGNSYIAYAFVGIGACIYSPAKYGILKEIKGEEFLVKANAMIEGSTIVAILVGVVMGGILADVAVENNSFPIVIGMVAAVYLVASISNLFIPKLPPLHTGNRSILMLFKGFIKDFSILWSNFHARIAILGTSLFFGIGATLRFWLIAWVPQALNISDNKTPAILNAVVAIGIVVGSIVSAKIPLSKAHKVISAGIGMGIGTIGLSLTNDILYAYCWLVTTGICGGLFLVPLNALLQNKGHELVGGGHAVAIQNFVENTTMLVMLGIYLSLTGIGLSAMTIGYLLGGLVMTLMLTLRLYASKHL